MSIKRLARKYKGSYVVSQERFKIGNQESVRNTLVFVSDKVHYEIKEEFERLKSNSFNKYSSLPFITYKPGTLELENLFISILLDRGILKENEVSSFRSEILKMLIENEEDKAKLFGILLLVVVLAILIIISSI